MPDVREVYVEVEGVPVPQGSMRALKSKAGFPYVTSANPALRGWREAVRAAVRQNASERMEGAIYAYIVFILPRPKSSIRPRPCVRPDTDKLSRAILDACTDAGVWFDDGQVTELHAFKHYAKEGESPKVKIYLKEIVN